MATDLKDRLEWFAVRVKPRHEKSVATQLTHKGYEDFLPLHWRILRRPHRSGKTELPLFPGYLFCRFDRTIRMPILTTPGVIHIVGVGREPLPVDENEIAALQQTVRSGLEMQPWPFLKIGQRVTIENGPLRGISGILLKSPRSSRLILSVTLMQRAVKVDIGDTLVSPDPNGRLS